MPPSSLIHGGNKRPYKHRDYRDDNKKFVQGKSVATRVCRWTVVFGSRLKPTFEYCR